MLGVIFEVPQQQIAVQKNSKSCVVVNSTRVYFDYICARETKWQILNTIGYQTKYPLTVKKITECLKSVLVVRGEHLRRAEE